MVDDTARPAAPVPPAGPPQPPGQAAPGSAPLAASAAATSLPVFRLPTEPYPGLRPFLDHESPLLFGRARQVREVIDHLRETQFVAVLGGSGSGKSSLIHAGVVPELRSFGIPGAGDFWIPMVCIPGTNPGEPRPDRPVTTPITRLAWKFARLLKSRGSAEADARRLDEIAATFRQDAGFTRLVDHYAAELDVPPGPDAVDARLLFVIDQFEELFHFTNKDSEDARRMVERVIDHFFNPHPRCYVVLTMRSEHLNDCASYLELPDAINKSSYLVRRLDEEELRDAIRMPAQRFLRLLQRQKSAAAATLPAEVAFDDGVLERLLHDARAITHDPDHLPLLQHLLARVWETACRREGVGAGGVPAAIVPADLAHAVLAAGADDTGDAAKPLDDKLNVLRAGVENWAEAIFQRRLPSQRAQLEALLKRLAFKDPNTGMYTQQRVDVDDPKLFGDDSAESATRAALWRLIEDPADGRAGQYGYVGSVDYLFWDDENPKRVTLKVSHESFIRGWSRFRGLVDKEAERFDAFIDLLQRCARWAHAGRPDRQLLEAADLDRLNDERLPAVLADPKQRAAWFKVLRLDRDGPRLAAHEAEVDGYIAQSRERRQLAANRADRIRRTRRVAVAAALLLLPIVLFSWLVQSPVRERAELYFDAATLADQARQSTVYGTVGEAVQPLHALLSAADKVVDGRAGRARAGMAWLPNTLSNWLLGSLRGLPFVRAQAQFLAKVAGQSEPRVNGQLRLLLGSTLWLGQPPADAAPLPAPSRDIAAACTILDADPNDGNPPGPALAEGRLLMRTDRPDDALQRGIFVPRLMLSRREDVALLAAVVDKATNTCTATEMVLPVPRTLSPAALFDATMTHLLLATDDPVRLTRVVTLYQVDWQPAPGGAGWRADTRQVAVITDPAAYDRVRRQAGQGGTKVDAIDTWAVPGGRLFRVADQHWRLVSAAAQPLATAASEAAASPRAAEARAHADWLPLDPGAAGAACRRLGQQLGAEAQSNFVLSNSVVFESDGHCIQIKRGRPRVAARNGGGGGGGEGSGGGTGADSSAMPTPPPPVPMPVPSPAGGAGDSAGAAPFEDVLVAVYDRPGADDDGRTAPTPIASLPQFGRFAAAPGGWFIGAPRGRWDGWIALRQPPQAGHGAELAVAAPWSTAALARLGRAIESDQPPPASAVGNVNATRSDSSR